MTRLYDLYIINRDGLCLLHQKFGVIDVDSDLVGGFFSAIQQFMRDVLPIGDVQSIKSLDRGDFKLLIEHRTESDIFGIVICEKEDVEVRRKLIEILVEFEKTHKDKLRTFIGDVGGFQEFKNIILSKFPSQLITSKHIPEIGRDDKIIHQIINGEVNSVELAGINYVVTDDHRSILRYVNGQRTIEEISKVTEISTDNIIEVISLFVWNNLLKLHIQPLIHETDIFETKDVNVFFADSLEKQIVLKTFGEKGLQFLTTSKGLPIKDLAELSGIDIEMAKRMAANFLISGYIRKVGSEKALSLIDLKNSPLAIYAQTLKRAKGEDMGDLLKTIFNAGLNAATDFCQNRTDLIYESDGMWFGNMTDTIIEVIRFFHKYIDHTYSGKILNVISRDCFECYNFRFYEPVCYYTTGLINGVFNFCKSKKMVEETMELEVKEIECKATGADACKWAIKFVKK
ncbi:MAG: hypothetical protein HWN66_11515 [Candidatus Helarchaeota archaeon]|nr:hypothetical protein [Candidatus Helarchaeota archaeon]